MAKAVASAGGADEMRRFRRIEKKLADLQVTRCLGSFTFFGHICSQLEQRRLVGSFLAIKMPK
jgi:hypothetical protein